MTGWRDELLARLPDATVFARLGAVEIVLAPRADGLLHIRHLQEQAFPVELLGVPDLPTRPVRGFWSDAVVAAAREVPPVSGAEVVVGSAVGTPLSRSAELAAVTMVALAGVELARAKLQAAWAFLGVAAIDSVQAAREELRPPG